jgi:hypothetical protein
MHNDGWNLSKIYLMILVLRPTTTIPEPKPLDLSDSKTTWKKIALLYESGIIDFT